MKGMIKYMKVEVLVSTMNRENCDFLYSMNLMTDVVVGNQNGTNSFEEFRTSFGNVRFICSDKKGLSNNRNLTLENSNADICLLADDDIRYLDNYEKIIIDEFKKHPTVDIIIFNLYESPVKRYVIKKKFIVRKLNYLRFGSVRIAFKRESILRKNIHFDNNYGSGALIPMGEDNIFLHDCLKARLKILAVPIYLLSLTNERESTWFSGYDDAYFLNKGALYKRLYPYGWHFMCFQDVVRHRDLYGDSKQWYVNYKKMISKKYVIDK